MNYKSIKCELCHKLWPQLIKLIGSACRTIPVTESQPIPLQRQPPVPGVIAFIRVYSMYICTLQTCIYTTSNGLAASQLHLSRFQVDFFICHIRVIATHKLSECVCVPYLISLLNTKTHARNHKTYIHQYTDMPDWANICRPKMNNKLLFGCHTLYTRFESPFVPTRHM